MKTTAPNHYERAFASWLVENRIEFVAMDENKRAASDFTNIKTFDFLLYLSDGRIVITEVKGRSFKGTSLVNLSGLECWVTAEDIDGLTGWQKTFGPEHQVVFVFAYRIENVDVDFDGRDFFEYENNKYVFFAVSLDDYIECMKRRSPKWKTVTLPAEKFRQCAQEISRLLL